MNEMMVKCLFEFIGTAILVLFGDGVVASNVLKKSKGENGGWVVVTLAWGLAVMLGVFISGPYSGAHLNPAVTLGLAAAGTFSWSLVVPYIVAQMLGGFFGAVLVYLFYKDHYDATDDPAAKLATFCTAPAIRNYRRQNPDTWLDTGLDAFTAHMDTSTTNLLYDIACAVSVIGMCTSVIGIIPTALIVFS